MTHTNTLSRYPSGIPEAQRKRWPLILLPALIRAIRWTREYNPAIDLTVGVHMDAGRACAFVTTDNEQRPATAVVWLRLSGVDAGNLWRAADRANGTTILFEYIHERAPLEWAGQGEGER